MTTSDRLTHEQIKQVCHPRKRREQVVCPGCSGVLNLFGADSFDCKNGCKEAEIAKLIRNHLSAGTRGPKASKPEKSKPSELPDWAGFTLTDYSKLKRLSAAGLGVCFGTFDSTLGEFQIETRHKGAPVVCWPYMDERGKVLATKVRLSHDSGDTYFRPRDPHIPYGLWLWTNRPAQDGKWPKTLVLCEGESNTHTFFAHDIPALGISGANGWRSEFAKIPVVANAEAIFVAQDPDRGGEAFVAAVKRDLPKAIALSFAPHKDASALHIALEEQREMDGDIAPTFLEKINEIVEGLDQSNDLQIEERIPSLPRITGTIHDLAVAIAPGLPYECKVAALFTVIGAILSGKVGLEGASHIQPRLYTCEIGIKGSGKSGANKEVKDALRPLMGDVFLQPSVDSGPALVQSLRQHPRMILDPDELSDLFEKARASKEGKNGLANELLKLHDQNVTGNNAKGNIALFGEQEQNLDNAQISILAGATPSGFPELWTNTSGKRGGLQTRFTLFHTAAKMVPEPQPPTDYALVESLVKKLAQRIPENLMVIEYPAALREKHFAWSNRLRETLVEDEGSRAPAFVSRMLIILTVTNGASAVTDEILTQALALADYQVELHRLLMPEDSYGWVQANEQRILAAFKKHGSHGLTQNDIRRYVTPHKHPGGIGPFLQAWANLIKADYVRKVEDGRKSAIYIAVGD
jgi:hypothetical protein